MQNTLRWGTALPGDNRDHRIRRNGNDNTTRQYQRVSNNRHQNTITPCAILPNSLRQTYIDGNNQLLQLRNDNVNESLSETFGNSITTKNHDVIRLIGQNIGYLGVRTFANQKQEQGKEWLVDHQIDICCWQEIGLSMHMMKHHEKINERMRDYRWTKQRISATNNKHESIDKLQFGGTIVMAVNEAASRVHASGSDETGLGRWSWMLFEGHNEYRTRVISAYATKKIF